MSQGGKKKYSYIKEGKQAQRNQRILKDQIILTYKPYHI